MFLTLTRLFLLLLLGFASVAIGLAILLLDPYSFFFKQKVKLHEGGEIFENWRKPPVDLYIRIFLFNVTNSEEFMAGTDTKIKVKEVGPYVYRENLEHEVVKFNDNGTLTAVPKHPLTWIEELSEGHTEDDLLILPHIALLSIANVVSQQSFITRFGLNNLIAATKSTPLVKMTAKQFMMGYKSELLTLGNTFLPGWIYFDKLGLIDRMYDFEGDYETIFTGESDITTSGLIDTYKGSTDLPHWEGKHCSNIQYASDGTKFKSGVSMNESVLFYRKSLCRAAPLYATAEGIKSGLKAYRYTFPEDLLDNGKYNKDNKCFCRKGRCLPVGLIDVADCYYGFPIALSYPHFYKGEESLFSRVEGLSPNKELHETRYWVQPDSGLPLDISSKFQINMALDDIKNIRNTEKFSNMYLPLLWFDIRLYGLPPPLEFRFKVYLNVMPIVTQFSMYFLLISGLIMILVTVYRLTFNIMFKSVDSKKKPCNYVISTELWVDRETKSKTKTDKANIYSPCEIPLNDSASEDSDPQFVVDRRSSTLKTHSDRLKEISHRLSDKVYDSIGSVKDKVRGEFVHVKHIFKAEDKDSLINKDESATNEAFKSDSSEESEAELKGAYESVKQNESDEDCRYLEVLDDGSEFDVPTNLHRPSRLADQLERLDSKTNIQDTVLHIE